jgi:hypothetical protein
MVLTDRYLVWLHALAERDALMVWIAFTAFCLVGVYLLTVRYSPRSTWWVYAFVGVFYASLAAYGVLGLL